MKTDIASTITCIIVGGTLIAVTLWGAHHRAASNDVQQQLATVQARLKLCGEAVAQLDTEAHEREAAAAQALAAAQAQADKYQLRADRLLRQPAAVPGDDCASAKARARAWLEGRRS